MITQFPGTCACGCRKAFPRGAQVERAAAGGWVLASCARPAAARPALAGPVEASHAEVLSVLAQAKAVAARAAAAASRPAPRRATR
jgi:hypothetical protein